MILATAFHAPVIVSIVQSSLVQNQRETEQEAAERKKHPLRNAPERMTVEAVPHDVPVAAPLYLTVTMAPGKLVTSEIHVEGWKPFIRIYVTQIGPLGDGVPGGSGPAKIVQDRGDTKVIEVTPAQLGQVTFRLGALYSDNAWVSQSVQVHVSPVSKGLKRFTLGLPAPYAGIVEGDPGGEPTSLRPELLYEGLGTIYPDDLSAIKLTVEQPAGDPTIQVDEKGRLHFLRPGKATLVGEVDGVKCIVPITVFTNLTYPSHKR